MVVISVYEMNRFPMPLLVSGGGLTTLCGDLRPRACVYDDFRRVQSLLHRNTSVRRSYSAELLQPRRQRVRLLTPSC
jgi:hypothetical protein